MCRRVSARFSSGAVSSFNLTLSSIIRRARSVRADKRRPRKFLPKYVPAKMNSPKSTKKKKNNFKLEIYILFRLVLVDYPVRCEEFPVGNGKFPRRYLRDDSFNPEKGLYLSLFRAAPTTEITVPFKVAACL